MALLYHTPSSTPCTSSILSPTWLLTSYSCLAAASLAPEDWVLLGAPASAANNTDDTNIAGAQIQRVQSITAHPLTRRGQHLRAHDLALVRLEEELELGEELGAACLAAIVEEEETCRVAGWTGGEAGETSRQYLTTLPAMVPTAACNSSYAGQLEEAVVCEEQGVCGDLGAPLLCLRGGSWEVAGVATLAPGCGQGEQARPQLYTSIPEHRDWILHTIGWIHLHNFKLKLIFLHRTIYRC